MAQNQPLCRLLAVSGAGNDDDDEIQEKGSYRGSLCMKRVNSNSVLCSVVEIDSDVKVSLYKTTSESLPVLPWKDWEELCDIWQ